MTLKTTPVPGGMTPVWPEEGTMTKAATAEPVEEAEFREEETALVPINGATHHLVVGMGTLAAMDDDEFERNLAIMQKGQERIKVLMDKLLIKGEDYGTVKGIDRPFLHQPGAEKLSNFYGFAVEQEAERIVGTERPGWQDMGPAQLVEIGGRWLSPPLAYHVKSYVHLGDFSGPVIAMGYGEASSWEEKYRYRWSKPTCPQCGREGLIKGRADGKLKGKWWCPGKEGGCNKTFEAADPQIGPTTKVDNPDPYSMAETLIQMAGKRSFVASIRRATGTSGLFTQDEDSPSIAAQVGDVAPDEPDPVVTAGPTVEVAIGAKTTAPSVEQLQHMVSLAKEKGIKKEAIAELFGRLFGITVEPTSAAVTAAARSLTADQLGALLLTMDTGEIMPDPTDDKSIILEADGMPA
jgi:hypothetical protein